VTQPVTVDDDFLRGWPLPAPDHDADKEARGRVLVVGGSNEVPGAVLLAGIAALRVGAGKLRLATTATASSALAVALPEARVFGLPEDDDGTIAARAAALVSELAGSVDAVVVGPGMTSPDAIADLVASVAREASPSVVLDAAALLCVDEYVTVAKGLHGRLVLTPNRDELRAMGDPTLDALAAELGAVVSLKGATTRTVTPDGRVFDDPSGNPGLATSGSGDVVAGAVGGLLALGAAPDQAAVWANHLHARAGERLAARIAPLCYLAREIADELAPAMAEVSAGGGTGGR
jgi:ADP-dependent NAD(P)H-hydrate dehydratase